MRSLLTFLASLLVSEPGEFDMESALSAANLDGCQS